MSPAATTQRPLPEGSRRVLQSNTIPANVSYRKESVFTRQPCICLRSVRHSGKRGTVYRTGVPITIPLRTRRIHTRRLVAARHRMRDNFLAVTRTDPDSSTGAIVRARRLASTWNRARKAQERRKKGVIRGEQRRAPGPEGTEERAHA